MITRLLEIVMLLTNNGTLTASEIAEHFKVSPRTIYRDIDRLSDAGVPIVCERGKTGGIKLVASAFADINKHELTAALERLSEGKRGDRETMGHIIEAFDDKVNDWLDIDFGSEGKNSFFNELKNAVMNRRLMTIGYMKKGSLNEEKCVIEPMQLWYSTDSWYLKAYCHKKMKMIAFRLDNIQNYSFLGSNFGYRDDDINDCEIVN